MLVAQLLRAGRIRQSLARFQVLLGHVEAASISTHLPGCPKLLSSLLQHDVFSIGRCIRSAPSRATGTSSTAQHDTIALHISSARTLDDIRFVLNRFNDQFTPELAYATVLKISSISVPLRGPALENTLSPLVTLCSTTILTQPVNHIASFLLALSKLRHQPPHRLVKSFANDLCSEDKSKNSTTITKLHAMDPYSLATIADALATTKCKDERAWQHIASAALQHLAHSNMPVPAIAKLLSAYVAASIRNPGLFSELAVCLRNQLQAATSAGSNNDELNPSSGAHPPLNVNDVALALWALAFHGHSDLALASAAATVLTHALAHTPSPTSTDAPPTPASVPPATSTSTSTHPPALSPPPTDLTASSLARAVWAFKKMRHHDTSTYLALASAIPGLASTLKPPEVCMLATTFSKLPQDVPAVQEAMKDIGYAALSKLLYMKPDQAAYMIELYGRHERGVNGIRAQLWLWVKKMEVTEEVRGWHVPLLMGALVGSGCRETATLVKVCEAGVVRCNFMRPNEVEETLSHMVTANFSHLPFLKSAIAYVTALLREPITSKPNPDADEAEEGEEKTQAQKSKSGQSTHEIKVPVFTPEARASLIPRLPSILASLVACQHVPAELMKEAAPQLLHILPSLSPKGLIDAAWAYSTAGIDDPLLYACLLGELAKQTDSSASTSSSSAPPAASTSSSSTPPEASTSSSSTPPAQSPQTNADSTLSDSELPRGQEASTTRKPSFLQKLEPSTLARLHDTHLTLTDMSRYQGIAVSTRPSRTRRGGSPTFFTDTSTPETNATPSSGTKPTPGCFDAIPTLLKEAAEEAWKEQQKKVAGVDEFPLVCKRKDIERVLTDMGVSCRTNETTSDGVLNVPLAVRPSRHMWVAIEVVRKNMCTLGASSQPNVDLQIRWAQLAARGWQVCMIREHEWSALHNDEAAQKSFLGDMLAHMTGLGAV